MQTNHIEPASLIRLSRSPESSRNDKPRLLKVTVKTEQDLEPILLSSPILQDDSGNSERIFADVPWWERNHRAGIRGNTTHTEDRTLIILGVPEVEQYADRKTQSKHDFLQWKFVSDLLNLDDVTVVDTFRIPKSSRYMGTDPRPPKLTMLYREMVTAAKTQWQMFGKLLPEGVRLCSRTCVNELPGKNSEPRINVLLPFSRPNLQFRRR